MLRASSTGTGPATAPGPGPIMDFRAFRRAKGTLVSDNPNILIIWGDDIGSSGIVVVIATV